MSDVDNILKEAGMGLNDLLRAPDSPTGDVYRKAQDARLANFDALISTLRGPTQPEEAMRPAQPATQPASLFPKAPAGLDLRSTSQPLGIAAPSALPPIPASQPQPVAPPPLQVKRLERPR